jgi:hypothetical protein
MREGRSQGRPRPPRPAGDHDLPYVFGRLPCIDRPFPFALSEYARLLFMRGHLQDGGFSEDRDGRYLVTERHGIVWVEPDSDPNHRRLTESS